MIYTRRMFGVELKKQIMNRKSIENIGEWAYEIYLEYDIDAAFDDLLLTLATMEIGPEFARSYEELNQIADDLIAGKDVRL